MSDVPHIVQTMSGHQVTRNLSLFFFFFFFSFFFFFFFFFLFPMCMSSTANCKCKRLSGKNNLNLVYGISLVSFTCSSTSAYEYVEYSHGTIVPVLLLAGDWGYWHRAGATLLDHSLLRSDGFVCSLHGCCLRKSLHRL